MSSKEVQEDGTQGEQPVKSPGTQGEQQSHQQPAQKKLSRVQLLKYQLEVAGGIFGSMFFTVAIIFANKYLVQTYNFDYMVWHGGGAAGGRSTHARSPLSQQRNIRIHECRID